MERCGWLRRIGDAPHARARQVFRITPKGRSLLRLLRGEVAELYREVVGEEPSTRRAARARRA
jgi:DNA-binding PadR family transcriptional regulator